MSNNNTAVNEPDKPKDPTATDDGNDKTVSAFSSLSPSAWGMTGDVLNLGMNALGLYFSYKQMQKSAQVTKWNMDVAQQNIEHKIQQYNDYMAARASGRRYVRGGRYTSDDSSIKKSYNDTKLTNNVKKFEWE